MSPESPPGDRRAARGFIIRLGLTALLLAPIVGFFSSQAHQVSASPRAKGPWVIWAHETLDPSKHVQVWWETADPAPTSLWLAEASGGSFRQVMDDPEPREAHVVNLANLTADTRYLYRVGDPASPARAFRTAPARAGGPFNFTLLSDTQSFGGLGSQHRVAAAIARLDDTAFVANLGDLVQNGDVQAQWDYYFAFSEPWLRKFGFVPVTGNHDARGGWDAASLYPKYFNCSTPGGRFFYAFNWSDACFCVLEIAETGDADPTNDGGEQVAWFRRVMTGARDRAFRVVFFHREVYTNLPGNAHRAMFETWVPLFAEYNVSLVVYGHHHAYQRFWDGNCTYLCLGGGGANQDPVHVVKPNCERLAVVPNYVVARVNGSRLAITAYTPEGSAFDHVTLETGGSASEAAGRPGGAYPVPSHGGHQGERGTENPTRSLPARRAGGA